MAQGRKKEHKRSICCVCLCVCLSVSVCVCASEGKDRDHEWLKASSHIWLWLIGLAFFCLSTDRKVEHRTAQTPPGMIRLLTFFLSPRELSAGRRRHTPQSFAKLAQLTQAHPKRLSTVWVGGGCDAEKDSGCTHCTFFSLSRSWKLNFVLFLMPVLKRDLLILMPSVSF